MGAIWGRQDPGGPHVGLMNFAIWAMTDAIPHPYPNPTSLPVVELTYLLLTRMRYQRLNDKALTSFYCVLRIKQ